MYNRKNTLWIRSYFNNGKYSIHLSDPDCDIHGGGCDCPITKEDIMDERMDRWMGE